MSHSATRSTRRELTEFLAVGGVTLLLYPLSWLTRQFVTLDDAHLAVGMTAFYAAHVINDPHFAVSYLLFYRNVRERLLGSQLPLSQRVRFLAAGFVLPAAMLAWGLVAFATGSAQMIGDLLQLMFLLVGFHYVKQGFGVMVVLSMRRGVRFSRRTRWLLLLHAWSGFLFAWANPSRPQQVSEHKGVIYTSVPRPEIVESISLVCLVATAVLLATRLAVHLRNPDKNASLGFRSFTPASAFVISIWAWMIFASADPLLQYVIPALHAVQYLYFVKLRVEGEAHAHEGPPHFGPPSRARLTILAISAVALGFLLFDLLPETLDALLPSNAALGDTPYFAFIYAFINLHHYFMDGVLWRKEAAESTYLLKVRARAPE